MKTRNILLKITKEIKKLNKSKQKKALKTVTSILDKIIESNSDCTVALTIIQILSEIPAEHFKQKHLIFISRCFENNHTINLLINDFGLKLLPHLIENKRKAFALKLLKLILNPIPINDHKENTKNSKFEFSHKYELKNIISKNKEDIKNLWSIEVSRIVIGIIKDILSKDLQKFDDIITIEDHEQKLFLDDYEYQLVDLVRYLLKNSPTLKIEKTIKTLLHSKHEIFKRLAFHLINFHYDNLNSLFWALKKSPLYIKNRHELYELLKNHSGNFKEEQINTVLKWIKAYSIHGNLTTTLEEKNIKDAYYRKEWLTALLNCNHPEVNKLYETYNKMNPENNPHPGFDGYHYPEKIIFGASNSDVDTLLNQTNQEIADTIKNYPKSKRLDEQISFYYSISEAVSKNPIKFTSNLEPFLTIPKKFLPQIIQGFEQALKNNTPFELKELFTFISKIIEEDSFWNVQNDDHQNQIQHLIIVISNLINTVSNSDNAEFSNILNSAENIIIKILDTYKEEKIDSFDLRTGIGSLLLASISLSRIYSRNLANKTQKARFPVSIKKTFTQRLKNKDKATSTSMIIARFYTTIAFLDEKWLNNNFNTIFNLSNENHWELAIGAFFYGYTSPLSKDIYDTLRTIHYPKALTHNFKDEIVKKNIVGHIALGYFAKWDDITNQNSLILSLINNGSSDQLVTLINFVKRYKEQNKFDQDNIKVLWSKIVEKTKEEEKVPEKFKKPLLHIISWIGLFDELNDEILELSKYSTPYLNSYYLSNLCENISKLAPLSPNNISSLLLDITYKKVFCDYNEKYLIEAVTSLYKSDKKEAMDRVCNLYLKNGYNFLNEVYTQYNPKKNSI